MRERKRQMTKHFEGLAEKLAQKANGNTIRNVVKLHPETVANAEEVAKRVKPKRTITRRAKSVTAASSIKADPRVMDEALKLANGDHSRLTIERDGSVIVWNYPRTTKPQDNR
jgi:hypothetical protein